MTSDDDAAAGRGLQEAKGEWNMREMRSLRRFSIVETEREGGRYGGFEKAENEGEEGSDEATNVFQFKEGNDDSVGFSCGSFRRCVICLDSETLLGTRLTC